MSEYIFTEFIKIVGKNGKPRRYEVKSKFPALSSGIEVEIRVDEDSEWEKVAIGMIGYSANHPVYEAFSILDSIKTEPRTLKISFFAPSGSGKTEVSVIAEKLLHEIMDKVYIYHTDIASPLHEIQNFIYKRIFIDAGLEDIDCRGQDTVLLQFLAKHFENYLGLYCIENLNERCKSSKKMLGWDIVCINADCRNNAYHDLKNDGFIFIKIETDKELRAERSGRKVIVEDNIVEQIDQIKADYTIDNNGDIKQLEKNVKKVLEQIIKKG